MFVLFFFNDTATTEIYTLSLHDALPISLSRDDHKILWLIKDKADVQREGVNVSDPTH